MEGLPLDIAVGIRFAPHPGIRSRSSIWDQVAPSSAKYSRSVEASVLLFRARGFTFFEVRISTFFIFFRVVGGAWTVLDMRHL
jgi:hypothetical protein